MFCAKCARAENRRNAHRPAFAHPGPAVMANHDTILEPCPRIALRDFGAVFDFDGRKRCVDFAAIACHVCRKLARAHSKATQDRIYHYEIGLPGETPPEIEITGKLEIRID